MIMLKPLIKQYTPPQVKKQPPVDNSFIYPSYGRLLANGINIIATKIIKILFCGWLFSRRLFLQPLFLFFFGEFGQNIYHFPSVIKTAMDANAVRQNGFAAFDANC